MDRERLQTITGSVCPDSYPVVPARKDAGDESDGPVPRTRQPALLDLSLSDRAAAFRDVAEQIRALAKGEVIGADVGGDDAEWPPHADKSVRISHGAMPAAWGSACAGGRDRPGASGRPATE